MGKLSDIKLKDAIQNGVWLITSLAVFGGAWVWMQRELEQTIWEVAAEYHDQDMKRRDLTERINTLRTALDKASEENRPAIENMLEVLIAERDAMEVE